MTVQTSPSLAALANVPERIVQAWARHDAHAFAAVFTEDATMILPGVLQEGRDAIAQFMEQAFAGPYRGTRVMGTPFSVRVLSEDAAVLLTEGGVAEAGQKQPEDGGWVRATWVIVRCDDQWQLAHYQNTSR